MGLPDYLGWDWKSRAGHPDRLRARLSRAARQLHGDAALSAVHGRGPRADDSARRRAAAQRGSSARPSTKAAIAAATTSRREFADEYGSPLCIVKLGCWGPVVQCNVGKRGWMARHRRLSQRRRHLHRLHDARLSRQVHAVHESAARVRCSRRLPCMTYGRAIHALRRFTQASLNKVPSWRRRREQSATSRV